MKLKQMNTILVSIDCIYCPLVDYALKLSNVLEKTEQFADFIEN